jgi:ATP-dependent Lon protease
MPKENERDVQMTPDYVRSKIKVRFVSSIQEVLAAALVPQDDFRPGNDLGDQTRTAAS